MADVMRQEAPFPTILADLVDALEYRSGWRFWLSDLDRGQGSKGLTLVINVATTNSYPPHEPIRVNHYMLVPPAAFDLRSWRRWLLDQCLLVERHEACEFFTIAGDKPYAPHHQPGADPYIIFELGTAEEADTDFRGNRVHPPTQ
jgi:hypothetical protein